MQITSLRGLLPLHSTPTFAVATVSPDAPLSEVADKLRLENLGMVLVVADDLSLEGAVHADTVLRLAERLPTLPVKRAPMGRVARAQAPATREAVNGLLSSGEFVAVLVGAADGSFLLTPEAVAA